MKIENITAVRPVEFQPVTIQITFETLAELQAVKTAIGMNNGQMIDQRIANNGEEQTGNSADYFNACTKVYNVLNLHYTAEVQRQLNN
jgi:hypothetical protein